MQISFLSLDSTTKLLILRPQIGGQSDSSIVMHVKFLRKIMSPFCDIVRDDDHLPERISTKCLGEALLVSNLAKGSRTNAYTPVIAVDSQWAWGSNPASSIAYCSKNLVGVNLIVESTKINTLSVLLRRMSDASAFVSVTSSHAIFSDRHFAVCVRQSVDLNYSLNSTQKLFENCEIGAYVIDLRELLFEIKLCRVLSPSKNALCYFGLLSKSGKMSLAVCTEKNYVNRGAGSRGVVELNGASRGDANAGKTTIVCAGWIEGRRVYGVLAGLAKICTYVSLKMKADRMILCATDDESGSKIFAAFAFSRERVLEPFIDEAWVE